MDNLTLKYKMLNLELLPKMTIIPFESVIIEYEKYSGRFLENYSKLHIKKMQNYGRFNVAAVRIYHGNIHTRTFLLESFQNWMSITRMISYHHPMIPVLTVCKDLEEYAIANNFYGIFASINSKNFIYLNCFNHNSKSNLRLNKYPIYQLHRDTVDKITLIKNVLYNNTQQDLMSYPLSDEKHPPIQSIINQDGTKTFSMASKRDDT